MHTFIRPLAGLVVVGLLATGALAADVSPVSGTIGTEFTANFDGDIGAKPKIELVYQEPTAKSPKAKAKVTGVNGGQVTFVIQAAKGGGDFEVGIKGSDETAGTIALVPPRVDSADKATVAAGEELVLSGAFFGDDANKRNAPKVFVNGKKAKTRSFSGDTLTVQVHKKTSAGLADITVQNKIGETTFNGQVTVTTPPKPIKGADSLSTKVNGKTLKVKFTKKTPEAVVAVMAVNRLQISMAKVSGNPRKAVRTQQLTINVILPTSLEDLPIPTTFNPVDGVIYQDSVIKTSLPPSGTTGFYSEESGNTVSLTITGRSGDRISGTFSGTVNKTTGEGPGSVEFTGGQFVVTVEQ